MMKHTQKLLIAAAVIFTVIFVSFCGTPPKTETVEAAFVPEPTKEIVMEPSGSTDNSTDISEATFGCIFCHGFFYEAVQELTADFVYYGEKVQPHVFLDTSLHSAHETDKPADCLLCHDEHEIPEPLGDVRKPNLSYCLFCHHTGEFFSCVICHGTIP